MTRLLIAYAAGSAGAAINTLTIWLAGKAGLIAALHTTVATQFILPAVYLRLVWGGIWGFSCLFPGLTRMKWLQAALFVSLFPTAAQLFYFFPAMGAGWLGLAKGPGTPFVVFVANFIWGLVTTFLFWRA